ncbi:MAG: oligosaccharide flippase family protein [Culicoidibacterales bacterium]
MKQQLHKLIETGFFHVFGSNVLNKIMQFASGIFIVRILSQAEYGTFTYAQNIIAFFLLLNGFGIMQGLLQFGSKAETVGERDQYLKYALKISFVATLVLMLGIAAYYVLGDFISEKAKFVFLLMIFSPAMLLLNDCIQIKNRIDLNNQRMAKFSNLNTFTNLAGMMIGGYFYGAIGIVIGKYIGNLISVAFFYKSVTYVLWKWHKIPNIDKLQRKEMRNFSLIAMMNNSVAELLYLIDVFLIGLLLVNDVIIAQYKTATLIPTALSFIPMSLMIYVYPYFARNSADKEWVYTKYKQMLLGLGAINFLISAGLIVLAEPLVVILFGEQYREIIPLFQVLAIGYFFAGTFRIPSGNILASIGEIKYNFYTSIISGAINIILSIALINLMGPMGAAIATVSVFIVAGFMGNWIIFRKINPKLNPEVVEEIENYSVDIHD